MGYRWDFSGLVPYAPAFAHGVVVTLELSVLSSLIGTLLGVPLAMMLRARRGVSVPSAFGVDLLRAVPNLVLIFFFYYFPYEQVFGLRAPSGFMSVLVALVLAQAAYSAELFRAAMDQVPRAQVLGVEAIGFKPHQVVRFVVLPSVAKQVLPGHVALWVGYINLSSLASVIRVEDVVFVAKVAMSQSFRSLEAWTEVALVYCALVLPLTYALRKLETSAWIRRQ